MVPATTGLTPAPTRPAAASRRRRTDIEGLRAVAILAVVAYHAHVGLLGGGYVGVDVFFVISGYLITDHLWRELGATGRISLPAFYARRARRLLPAAMLVLVVTVAAAAVWLPPLEMRSVWVDGAASALYVGNYRLALTGTDYLASTLPSPVQHYWSLGVEEQFYLLWPLLLLLVAMTVRRRRTHPAGIGAHRRVARPRRPLGPVPALAGLAGVAATSFVFSLWLTRADAPWAFFSLPSRAWELAVGGLVAVGAPFLGRVPARAAACAGWVGLAAVGWATVADTASTAFPGTAAVVPVVGAAAVVAAGLTRPTNGPVRLLGRRSMRAVGRLSYSWYLWHWPVLIIAPYALGHRLSSWEYLALAVASAGLAAVTYGVVERPVLQSAWLAVTPRRGLLLGGALSVAGVAACLVAVAATPPITGHGQAPVAAIELPSAGAVGRQTRPGRGHLPPDPALVGFRSAQAQVEAAVARSAAVSAVPVNLDPPLGQAGASESAPFVDGCLLSFVATSSPPCVFGDTTSGRSMVLFGDSHATMWYPAVDSYAVGAHLALRVWTKATCPPVDLPIFSPVLGREYRECDEWRSGVLSAIAASHPAVVVLATAPNYDLAYQVVQDGPQWLAGLARMIGEIRNDGSRVVVVGPVPSPDTVVADCLSAHLSDMAACAVRPTGGPDGAGLFGYDTAGMAAERTVVDRAGGWWLDVKPWFCTTLTCPAVVDDLLVYRDNSHLTVPYATYLAPLVGAAIRLARRAGVRVRR